MNVICPMFPRRTLYAAVAVVAVCDCDCFPSKLFFPIVLLVISKQNNWIIAIIGGGRNNNSDHSAAHCLTSSVARLCLAEQP